MKDLKDYTNYLFNCQFNSADFDPEGKENHLDIAEEMKEKYSWKKIIVEWVAYLYEKCNTPQQVLNYCNLFIYYGGADNYVPDVYKFSGYLIYKTETLLADSDVFNLIDGLIISILEYQGLINLNDNPYYSIEKDEKIIFEKKKWEENKY